MRVLAVSSRVAFGRALAAAMSLGIIGGCTTQEVNLRRSDGGASGNHGSETGGATSGGASAAAGKAGGSRDASAGGANEKDVADGNSTMGAGCVPAVARADGSLAGECPSSLPGPSLVLIPAPQGCTYCIDSTEVTNAQYREFLTAKKGGSDASGQDPWCEWNTTYAPLTDAGPLSAPAGDLYPVVNIDWCDAFAYCKWAGKHLCGRIGGGPNPPAGRRPQVLGEWFYACSKGGTLNYPYGNAYDGAACNVADQNNFGQPQPVAAKTTCEGGYPGLFDMAGNVEEFENACDSWTGPNDLCYGRGGSWGDTHFSSQVLASCPGVPPLHSRDIAYALLGFRCCAPSL